MATAGADRVSLLDLHESNPRIFDKPVDHLYSSSVFIPYQILNLPNLTIAAPDMGGSNRANTYARFLNSEMVGYYKHREKANEVGKMMLIGDVTGKDIVIVDDMVDTAGTLTKAAELMIELGQIAFEQYAPMVFSDLHMKKLIIHHYIIGNKYYS